VTVSSRSVGKSLLKISSQNFGCGKTRVSQSPLFDPPPVVRTSLGGRSHSSGLDRLADREPCSKVDQFTLDNLRYRYLLPEEEPKLISQLDGPRAHLKSAVIIALGTGMRMGEQLRMKRQQVDFLRNILTARH